MMGPAYVSFLQEINDGCYLQGNEIHSWPIRVYYGMQYEDNSDKQN